MEVCGERETALGRCFCIWGQQSGEFVCCVLCGDEKIGIPEVFFTPAFILLLAILLMKREIAKETASSGFIASLWISTALLRLAYLSILITAIFFDRKESNSCLFQIHNGPNWFLYVKVYRFHSVVWGIGWLVGIVLQESAFLMKFFFHWFGKWTFHDFSFLMMLVALTGSRCWERKSNNCLLDFNILKNLLVQRRTDFFVSLRFFFFQSEERTSWEYRSVGIARVRDSLLAVRCTLLDFRYRATDLELQLAVDEIILTSRTETRPLWFLMF